MQDETAGLIEYVYLRMDGQVTVGDGRTFMVAGNQIDGNTLVSYRP
jgi:hypothetical protein